MDEAPSTTNTNNAVSGIPDMKFTSHSEYGELRSVYLKRPQEAMVNQERIGQTWKELNFTEPPDFVQAQSEHAEFERLFQNCPAKIHYLPIDEGVTMDSLYCRDASVATDFGMIVCNMGKQARAVEPLACRKVFEAAGNLVLGAIESPGTLEGGDVAWLDTHTIAVGHTYRTNKQGIRQFKALLEPRGIEVITADLPHYKGPSDVFHLMSIVSPIDRDLIVIYSPLMPIAFRNVLVERGFKFVEVPDAEFYSMGCNVLAIGPRKVILVDGNPETRSKLAAEGCKVYTYHGGNISVKGGGGPTCLTRPMVRAIPG